MNFCRRVNIILTTIILFFSGAGEASADVPGEDEYEANDPADEVADMDLNEKEDVKKKRRRNRGKSKKQTDPPTIPVSSLFSDGLYCQVVLN